MSDDAPQTDAGRPLWRGLWQRRLVMEGNRFRGRDPQPALDLGALLGERFVREVWGRRPLVLEVPPLDGDWVQRTAALASELAATGRVGVQDREGRRPAAPADVPDAEQVISGIGDRLVNLQDAHWEEPALAGWQRAFSSFFGCPVTTGLYLNGGGAPGFVEHHDAHHVFAVQLAGRKAWWIGPPTVANPSRRYDNQGSRSTASERLEVGPGQLLYLPAGWRHRAECVGEVSVHVTFGVHPPRYLDALEALIEAAGRRDPDLRRELGARIEADGLHWGLGEALPILVQRLELERRRGGLRTTDGVAIATIPAIPSGPVPGEWPVLDGVFAPWTATGPVGPERARVAASQLVERVAGLRAVYLRGSALEDEVRAHRFDLDLLLIFEGEAGPAEHVAVRAVVDPLDEPERPFDLRPVSLAAVRDGTESPYVRLCLAARSACLAGTPVWEEPPPVEAGPALARALALEAIDWWKRVVGELYAGPVPVSGPRFEPEAVAWLQKRALRMASLEGLALAGRFTRHPVGCAQLCAGYLPELGPLAERVCRDLLAREGSNEAASAAIELGTALVRRWSS